MVETLATRHDDLQVFVNDELLAWWGGRDRRQVSGGNEVIQGSGRAPLFDSVLAHGLGQARQKIREIRLRDGWGDFQYSRRFG